MSPLEKISGRPRVFALGATAVGGSALVAALTTRRWEWVFGALTAGWLLCAGMAAGAVALCAIVRVAQGKWASEIVPAAEAAAGFFTPALLLLALITLAGPLWIRAQSGGGLESLWLPARDVLTAAILFWIGRRALRERERIRWSVIYLIAYALILSIWAMDLVLGLREGSPSTAVPAFYFMGSLLSGLAWATLASTWRAGGVQEDARHDAGKLIFALATFWAYLVWALFLPTWYANVPDETAQLLAEVHGLYRPVAYAMGIGVLGMPFTLLLLERGKRNMTILRCSAISVLVGLGLERFLLVFPALNLNPPGGMMALAFGIELGVLGLFMLFAMKGPPTAARLAVTNISL